MRNFCSGNFAATSTMDSFRLKVPVTMMSHSPSSDSSVSVGKMCIRDRSYGNYTDSSLDLFSSWIKENPNSLFTQDPACDGNWRSYSDRNVNVRLELYNGSEWVAAAPQETTYYDEHTVLGLSLIHI